MPRRTWTDQQLADAIAGATTWADVLRSLRVGPGGSTRRVVRERAHHLGLDIRQLVVGGRRRRWTDDDLADAVAAATNLRQVFLELGLSVGGGAWIAMQQHISRLELDTSHWVRGPLRTREPRVPLPTWTDDDIRGAYDGARSVAEIMRRLGLDATRKRGRRAVELRLEALDLDPSALAGQGWNRGRTVPLERRRGRPLEEILVADSDHGSTPTLKRRLIDAGLLERRCAWCRIETWLGQAAPLHLDHVNGDRTDNRIENLRLRCPNCHALTDTYCGRNVRSG